jgi:hypothetical protein
MARTYDGKQVLVSVGDRQISGLADGDFLELAFRSQDHEDYVGTDGEVTIAPTNDPRVDVTITLAQSSQSNDVLSELQALGGTHRFVAEDLLGTTRVEGQAWFRQRPNLTFGRSVGSRAWQMTVEAKTANIGGNS